MQREVNLPKRLKATFAAWHIPKRAAHWLTHVVLQDQGGRAHEARRALGCEGRRGEDLPPHFWIGLVEDLERGRRLSHPEVVLMRECILMQVTRDGQWKPIAGCHETEHAMIITTKKE
jgi:hypothetical protein